MTDKWNRSERILRDFFAVVIRIIDYVWVRFVEVYNFGVLHYECVWAGNGFCDRSSLYWSALFELYEKKGKLWCWGKQVEGLERAEGMKMRRVERRKAKMVER